MTDPRDLGAQCDRCWLSTRRAGGPVPSEINPGCSVIAIGEAPGEEEVKAQIPFVGRSGKEINQALRVAGLERTDASFLNSANCRPLREMERVLEEIKAENKRRVAVAKEKGQPFPELVLAPGVACRPRLLAELAAIKCQNVIALGGEGHRGFLGIDRSDQAGGIMAVRGIPVIVDLLPDGRTYRYRTIEEAEDRPALGRRYMYVPALHPAHVLRARRWTKVFRGDVAKAVRWFEGRLEWRMPPVILRPSAEELERYLLGPVRALVVHDIETEYYDRELARYGVKRKMINPSLQGRIYCIGFFDGGAACNVPLLSIDGETRFYEPDEEDEIRSIMRRFYADPARLKGGWNCLFEGARVMLADGSSMPIERIVRQRLRADVMAQNARGEMTVARVTNWIRKREPNQRWIVVEPVGLKPGARGLTLTPDHEVYTQRGRVRADEVTAGDEVYLSEPKLTQEQRQAVLGTALGDSTLIESPTVRRSGKQAVTAHLRCSHVAKSRLTERKVAYLRGILEDPTPKQGGGFGAGALFSSAKTPLMRQLGDMLPLLYEARSRARRITAATMRALGDIGWAWWFMDDGNKKKHRGKATVELALCRYDSISRRIVAEEIRRRFGPVTVYKNGVAGFSVAATEAFCLAVGTHVFPELRYKLPEWISVPAWDEWRPPERYSPFGVRVAKVYEYTPPSKFPQTKRETSYCLTTTEGNFFTNYGLVSNCRYFDKCVIKRELGVSPEPEIDGIMLHKSVDPEFRHNLGFVASVMTAAPSWKDDDTGTEARSDEDLHSYNAKDCVITSQLINDLAPLVRLRKQEQIVQFDHRMQDFCLGLHENGMWVDQAARAVWDKRLQNAAYWCRRTCRMALGKLDFNPGSADQLRALMYDEWGLMPEPGPGGVSKKTGKPSTGDDVIRAKLLRAKGKKRRVLRCIRWYRRKVKYRGTYVTKLKPFTEYIDDSDYDELMLGEDADELDVEESSEDEQGIKGKKRGCVLADGRVHANWLAHGAVSGRWSSSDPTNLMNFPRLLRNMIRPQPGDKYVYCDKDQIELRIVTSLAGAARYSEIFWNAWKVKKAGKKPSKLDPRMDPHSGTAQMVFPAEWAVADDKTKERIRDFSKRLQYAIIYGAEIMTVYDVIVSTENKRGHLIYADMSRGEVQRKYDTWIDANPEIVKWWSDVVEEYRKQGYLAEPILGRRCDFLDGMEGEKTENQLKNYKCQAATSSAVGLALIDLIDGPLPFQKWGPGTGLVSQCHDSVMFEVPDSMAEWTRGVVEEAMNQTFEGKLSIPLTATAKIIGNWAEG